jgi:hypothetical protein
MQFEEHGERIKDLRLILERAAYAATLFDEDGISIRFMNSNPPEHLLDGIKSEQQIDQLMQTVRFSGLTPMGTQLDQKVIHGILLNTQKNPGGRLKKPVLIITITDGQPAGEAQDAVIQTIRNAANRFRKGHVNFQFAQVGNDTAARDFLGKLDKDPVVGGLVDCTSSKSKITCSITHEG